MTWLFHTGFESGVIPSSFEGTTSDATIETTDPNSGARCLQFVEDLLDSSFFSSLSVYNRPGTSFDDANSTTLAFAIKIEDVASLDSGEISMQYDASTIDTYLGFDIQSDGSIRVVSARNSAFTSSPVVHATSAPGVIQDGQWYDIEFRGYPGNADGFFELSVNGALLLSDSSIDTNQGLGSLLTSWGYAFRLDAGAPSGQQRTIWLDDFRIGQSFTGPEGAMVHEVLTPNSTTENDGIVSGAATAHEALDGIPPSELDAVILDDVNDRLLMGLTNRTETGDVATISVISTASAPIGTPTVRTLYEEGGTESQGPQMILDAVANTRYVTGPIDVNLRTGLAWTTADINALQVGAFREA